MLSSPVYAEARPRRSTAFVSRMGLRDAAFASRMNLRDAVHRDSPKPFNSFTSNGFRTLLHNGAPQPMCFQMLPDSFHYNGGVYPSLDSPLSLCTHAHSLRDLLPRVSRGHLPGVTYSFRINTYKSVSKQMTLTPFRMNTYEKQGGDATSHGFVGSSE
jgi:hypothetical protein